MDGKLRTLLNAVWDDNRELVLSMIDDGVDVNGVGDLKTYFNFWEGTTPLYVASIYSKLEIAQILIGNGADVNKTTKDQNTPLYIAADFGYWRMVQLLIDHGAEVNTTWKGPNEELTPLYFAAQKGHSRVVKLLIEHGAEVNKTREDESTPLFIATRNGRLEVVKLLLANGADMNKSRKRNNEEMKPLHVAAQYGHTAVFKLILEHGADGNTTTEEKSAPIVSGTDHSEVVRLLLENEAYVNKNANVNNVKVTPLFFAARYGRSEVVKLLIEQFGADVNVASKSITPLSIASENEHREIVNILLKIGALVDTPNPEINNLSPLSIVVKRGHFKVAEFLIANGADVQTRDQFGYSPLHIACRGGREDMALLLLDNGADINVVNDNRETPLHVAVNKVRNHLDLVKVLLHRGADVDARNKGDYTALEKALELGQFEIKVLITSSHKSKSHLSPQINESKQLNLSRQRSYRHSSLRLKEGERPILRRQRSHSPHSPRLKVHTSEDNSMMKAAFLGNTYMLTFLLNTGTSVNAKDQFARTPLFAASKNGHLEAVRLLVDRGANIHAKDNEGATSLDAAAHGGHETLVQFLIDRGSKRGETGMSRREGVLTDRSEEIPSDGACNIQGVNAKVSKAYLTEEPYEVDRELTFEPIQEDQLAYLTEVHRKNVIIIQETFLHTADFITHIETTMNKSNDEKIHSPEALTTNGSKELEDKQREVEQLQRRIEEMQNFPSDLSHEALFNKVASLEEEKTRLSFQIEQMRKDQQNELETQRDELLKEGERRIEKLKSRIDELEREVRTLLKNNATLEGNLEQLAIKFEEDQKIIQSSGDVKASVAIKKKMKFKNAAGLREGVKYLSNKLHKLRENIVININHNHIQASGTVNGSIIGDIDSLVANI